MIEFTNEEIEKTVLGALCELALPTNFQLIDAMDSLDVDCFTGFERQYLFQIMVKEHVEGRSISQGDLMMPLSAISDSLLPHLLQCKELVYGTKLLSSWITKLQLYRKDRKTIKLLTGCLDNFQSSVDRGERNNSISELQDGILLLEQSDSHSDRHIMSSKTACKAFKEENAKGANIISSGIEALDNLLEGGFKPGQLIAIGAPSSTGKTHFGLKLLWDIHKQQPGTEAIVFSLEATSHEVIERLIAHEAQRQYKHLDPHGKIKYEKIYEDSNVSICDKSPISVDYIRSYCKRAQTRNNISVILVDYLDRVQKSKGTERTDEKLAHIAESLANLAKDFNCLIILTTQLSKEAIRRSSHRPEMSDSKNTNGTAEAASYWIGMKRINQWDNGEKYPDSDLVEIILDKNRYGQQGIVWLRSFGNVYFDINQELAKQYVEQGNLLRKEKNKPEKMNFDYLMK